MLEEQENQNFEENPKEQQQIDQQTQSVDAAEAAANLLTFLMESTNNASNTSSAGNFILKNFK